MPLPDNSADVLYSSHMMEHLDHAEALGFLREAYRVLRPGGVIRLVMPDLRKIAQDYMANGDADAFVRDTLMFTDRPRTLLAWLRHIITGPRHHLWMYDGRSLVRHLTEAGFLGAAQLAPGKTNIIEPGALSLSERAAESVFVEAVKPRA
jgi:predicted SAM-dependent methyltransferase